MGILRLINKKMKNIYSILFLLAALIGFSSCESDRDSNPALNVPDSFVLNTPAYVSGVYDLKNTQSVLLTCTQPDYGFTAATTYKVQVSLSEDFATSYTLPTTYNTAKMYVLGNEFAIGVCTLMVDAKGYDENNFPTTNIPIYVRLVANLGSVNAVVNSNVIELPQVKPFFALPPMKNIETMYLNGAILGDADWNKSVAMVPVHSNVGKFWTIQYFGTTSGDPVSIKFNSVKDDNEGTPFSVNAQIDEASKTLAGITTNNSKLTVGKPGWYLVVATATINGRTYDYKLEFLEPKVYLIGPTTGGWDIKEENAFAKPAALPGEFVSPAFTAGGELRMCIKLDNIDWWKTEFIVRAGKIEYRGAGGDQEPRIQVTAGQKVYLNFPGLTGSIK